MTYASSYDMQQCKNPKHEVIYKRTNMTKCKSTQTKTKVCHFFNCIPNTKEQTK